MKEALDLEALGYRFRLRQEDGIVLGLSYRHPDAVPPANVASALFAALRLKKWAAVDYLQQRYADQWLKALERWEADPDPANDLPHARELAELRGEERPRHLVILDGTWFHAKKIYDAHAWLRDLPHVQLTPNEPSRYRVRRQPRPQCLATLEAIVHAEAQSPFDSLKRL